MRAQRQPTETREPKPTLRIAEIVDPEPIAEYLMMKFRRELAVEITDRRELFLAIWESAKNDTQNLTAEEAYARWENGK